MKFMTSLSLLVIAVTLSVGLASAGTKRKSPPQESFHVAQSDAEKALDDILRRYNTDHNMFAYVVGRPWYDAKKDTGYSLLFTKNLLQAVAKAESDAVKDSCGGKYIKGELCGLDFNPITCAQDYSEDGYLYRTIEDDGHKAIMFYLWAGHKPSDARTFYRLIKNGDHWKLDGVDCGNGDKFNMDDQ